MQAQHGIRHEEFMYNDFVLLGPENDPAQVRGMEPIAAMKRIATLKHRFISRGDDSGTHKRELNLWKQAKAQSGWPDYLECGQGMGPTLVIANERLSYTLADRGTFLKFRQKIELVPLTNAAESLRNPYAVIVINPQKHEQINAQLANAFVEFLISQETQQRIADYQIAQQQLFFPHGSTITIE